MYFLDLTTKKCYNNPKEGEPMNKFDRLRQKNENISNQILRDTETVRNKEDILSVESERIIEIVQNANVILSDIDEQFEKATKLKGIDITFLFFATALQCVRQYIIGTITQRVDDQKAANKTKGHEKESSDRHHRLYNPSLNEIITNPVPFDAIYGSKKFDLGIGGGFTHRAKTVGHDPLLGWIFGTANIATSTVTVSEGFKTFHVLTGETASGNFRDQISKNASTMKVFETTISKLLNEGIEGKEKIGVSLMKEAIHLKSDMYSTASIPIPVVSSISVRFARTLADYGIDMGNVLKVSQQAGYAVLINSLIGMIHGLFYDETQYSSWNLYSVKTRKILSYSNLIASASNVIAVAIAAIVGAYTGNAEMVEKSINYLDIGGIIVTIYRLINDRNFILEVKKEFLEHEWYNIILNE